MYENELDLHRSEDLLDDVCSELSSSELLYFHFIASLTYDGCIYDILGSKTSVIS